MSTSEFYARNGETPLDTTAKSGNYGHEPGSREHHLGKLAAEAMEKIELNKQWSLFKEKLPRTLNSEKTEEVFQRMRVGRQLIRGLARRIRELKRELKKAEEREVELETRCVELTLAYREQFGENENGGSG